MGSPEAAVAAATRTSGHCFAIRKAVARASFGLSRTGPAAAGPNPAFSCSWRPIAGSSRPIGRSANRPASRSAEEASGLHLSVDVQGPEISWSAAAESSIYRIAQEALANVWQHAKATSAAIKLHSLPGSLRLSIEDDGDGIAQLQARKNCIGTGLSNIRERARQLGGRLYIRRLLRGTRVTIVIKIPNHQAFAPQ